MRNVEIKAKIRNLNSFLEKARIMSDKAEVVLVQADTYFKVQKGRLKLRETQNEKAELIYYDRPNTEGPKLSDYSKQDFYNSAEAEGLKTVLESSLGIIGVVNKKRHLLMFERTRIHVDDVEDLGSFMELEVMLSENETVEDGQKVADDLMNRLGIHPSDLISCSNIDMLINKQS